jgi:hypothetical protein
MASVPVQEWFPQPHDDDLQIADLLICDASLFMCDPYRKLRSGKAPIAEIANPTGRRSRSCRIR